MSCKVRDAPCHLTSAGWLASSQ